MQNCWTVWPLVSEKLNSRQPPDTKVCLLILLYMCLLPAPTNIICESSLGQCGEGACELRRRREGRSRKDKMRRSPPDLWRQDPSRSDWGDFMLLPYIPSPHIKLYFYWVTKSCTWVLKRDRQGLTDGASKCLKPGINWFGDPYFFYEMLNFCNLTHPETQRTTSFLHAPLSPRCPCGTCSVSPIPFCPSAKIDTVTVALFILSLLLLVVSLIPWGGGVCGRGALRNTSERLKFHLN